MPVTPAGLQPAQPPLTAGAESGPVSRRQSPPETPPRLVPTVTHTHPPAQRLPRQLDPISLSLTPRPTPHRAGGTDSASPPRDFVPWRFSDAGLPACGAARYCRRPKTCTESGLAPAILFLGRRSLCLPADASLHRNQLHRPLRGKIGCSEGAIRDFWYRMSGVAFLSPVAGFFARPSAP